MAYQEIKGKYSSLLDWLVLCYLRFNDPSNEVILRFHSLNVTSSTSSCVLVGL